MPNIGPKYSATVAKNTGKLPINASRKFATFARILITLSQNVDGFHKIGTVTIMLPLRDPLAQPQPTLPCLRSLHAHPNSEVQQIIYSTFSTLGISGKTSKPSVLLLDSWASNHKT